MIDLAALGLRDYLLIAAFLAAVYLVFLLLPLLRLGRKSAPALAAMPDGPVLPAAETGSGAAYTVPGLQRDEPGFAALEPRLEPEAADGAPAPRNFSQELAESSRDREIRALRREMDQLRAEMHRISEELAALRVARNVSPLYREAMMLARQGESPAGIAAQCGISIGEAELVAALAREGAESDEKDRGHYVGA